MKNLSLPLAKKLGAVGLMWIVSTTAFAIASDAEAINKAGRQRMLSQRIAMSYFMIALNANSSEASQRIDAGIAEFQTNLMDLRDYIKDPAALALLDKQAQIWATFSTAAMSKPTQSQGQQVLAQSDALLTASEDVVQKISAKAGAGSSQIVAISGRQRMLSQKLGKYYLAMAWKLPVPSLEPSFVKTLQDFDANIQTLSTAPQNTPAITTALTRVRSDWNLSKAAFSQYKEGRFAPLIVVSTSESILKQMDAITNMYVGVAAGKK